MTFIPGRTRFVLGGCVAALVVLVSGCVPRPPAPPPPTVIIYGDSLTVSSQAYIEAELLAARPGWRRIVRAHGGTAICDWLAQMRADGNLNARLVVIQMSGNTLTPCMAGIAGGGSPEQVEKYRADADVAASIWAARGVKVLFLGNPRAFSTVWPPTTVPHPLDIAYLDVASRWASQGVSFSNAPELALAASDGGVPKARLTFPFMMQCLPEEMGRPECVLDPSDGVFKIQVRDGAPPAPGEVTTRGHLCPVAVSPCPVYASGIVRFARGIASAAVPLMV